MGVVKLYPKRGVAISHCLFKFFLYISWSFRYIKALNGFIGGSIDWVSRGIFSTGRLFWFVACVRFDFDACAACGGCFQS